MTDLDALEALLKKATQLPWTNRRQQFLESHAVPADEPNRWKARLEHNIRDTWACLITGPQYPAQDDYEPDEWDYPHAIALRWTDIKGDRLSNFLPEADEKLIVAAVNALPELIQELRELRDGVRDAE